MKLFCKRCKGTVWVEYENVLDRHYDFVCLSCGRRRAVDSMKEPIAKRIRSILLDKNHTTYYVVNRPQAGKQTVVAKRGGEWRIVSEKNLPDGWETIST